MYYCLAGINQHSLPFGCYTVSVIKQSFPILQAGKLVYLDSAATSQKPQEVIERELGFYTTSNANIHRGIYPLSEQATEEYEAARADVAKFIGADSVIFTSGTTDSLNKLALMFAKKLTGERIIVSELEHHSNLLPWRAIPNAKIEYLPVKDFAIDHSNINLDAKLIALSLASNVTGAVLDIQQLVAKIKKANPGCIVVIDAAQAVAHLPINVTELGADFVAFSAHKMYGPTGVGVLWGRAGLLEELSPIFTGGGMIRSVSKKEINCDNYPAKFEAGTPPIAQAVGLAAACKFIKSIGWEMISKYEQELASYTRSQLEQIPEVELYHPKQSSALPVFSFSVEGIHPHDVAQLLGDSTFGSTKKEICIRAGHHCAQILHNDVLKIAASCRVSLGIYNTKDEIDLLVTKLNEIITFFKST